MKQITDTQVDVGKWLGGAVAGALIMYMLDPERGSARRARSGEKIRDLGHQTGQALGGAWHGVGSRFTSAVDEVRDSASRLSDSARPAAAAGRGLGESVARASHAASAAAGQLVDSLQGKRDTWAPTLRSAAVLGGGVLGLYGLLRRSPLGLMTGLAGIALLARGATNLPLRSVLRGEPLARTIDLEKSVWIDAPPERVYDMWTRYENFPQFMSHVVEVRDLGHRRSHWVVRGPAGTEFEWDAVLTEQTRPRRLAWRSEPGAEIAQSGSVEFEPQRGGTLVTVRMSYSPPAGAVGHGIAVLLGADPERQMDEDLARMKAFIERGELPHEAAQKSKSTSRFLH